MVLHKVGLVGALGAAMLFAADVQTRLVILHTNDLHGHVEGWKGWEGELAGRTVGGFDRIATVVRKTRAEAGEKNVLVLDAGDTFSDTLAAALSKGQVNIELMNRTGYDAMVPGNHEFDFGVDGFRERAAQATFPVVAANVMEAATGQTLVKPYVIREAAGVKVGILGLAYPNTPLTTAAKNVDGLNFGDAAAAARMYVPRMREEGAQVVIALSHLGLGADKKLAEQVPGIDVIVGGHSHNRMTEAMPVGATLIVQAGAHGSDVGRLDLTVQGGKITAHQRKLITLDHQQIAADPAMAKHLKKSLLLYRTAMEEKVGRAAQPIVRAQTLAGRESRKRDEESPADHLFAEILRETTGSDIALLPGVGYGVAIPAGQIRAAALRNLIPHESKVITLELTGAQVREILEQSVENTYSDDPAVKVGGMIQVSGVVFRYDAKRAAGERVTSVRVGANELETNRVYQVVTNTLLAQGGHRYTSFRDGKKRKEHGEQYAMVKDWLLRQGTPDLTKRSK